MSQSSSSAYEQLIAEQLQEERSTKTSLEQRAVWVVSSSGAIVTLTLGVVGLAAGEGALPLASRLVLLLAIGAFVVAAFLAIGVNRPRDYEESALDGLGRIVDEREAWVDDLDEARRHASENRLDILRAAKPANEDKAKQLSRALWSETIAILALGVAVFIASF